MALGANVLGATVLLIIAIELFRAVMGYQTVMGFLSRKNHFDVDGRVIILTIEDESAHADNPDQTVIITGGSQGMGRGLGKLLARKGANVVIVARNEQKLADALKYLSVCNLHISRQLLLPLTHPSVFSQEPTNSALPLHKRRPYQSRGEHAHHCRDYGVEQRQPSGHRMGQRRICPPGLVHRHTARGAQSADGHRLLGRYLPCSRNAEVVAKTIDPQTQRCDGQRSKAKTLPHHFIRHLLRWPRRLLSLRTRKSRPTLFGGQSPLRTQSL